MNDVEIGRKINAMRIEQGMSLRMVGQKAGITPGMISMIENNKTSPTLASLRKVLAALGSSFGDFFEEENMSDERMHFPKDKMKTVEDKKRRYTLILPRRKDIRMQLVFEEIGPRDNPELETHEFDVAGYVLGGGSLRLEVVGNGEWEIREGDGFYVPAGNAHRAMNLGKQRVRIITAYYPPRY